jgi:hypothetical protein
VIEKTGRVFVFLILECLWSATEMIRGIPGVTWGWVPGESEIAGAEYCIRAAHSGI